MPTVADFDKALHREIGAFRYDPLGFVMFAFSWGIPHTPLAGESGPEEWQRDVLIKPGNGLLDRHFGSGASNTGASEASHASSEQWRSPTLNWSDWRKPCASRVSDWR
jgi:hypothetical protein